MSQAVWFSWSNVTKITITGNLLKPHPYDVDNTVPQAVSWIYLPSQHFFSV